MTTREEVLRKRLMHDFDRIWRTPWSEDELKCLKTPPKNSEKYQNPTGMILYSQYKGFRLRLPIKVEGERVEARGTLMFDPGVAAFQIGSFGVTYSPKTIKVSTRVMDKIFTDLMDRALSQLCPTGHHCYSSLSSGIIFNKASKEEGDNLRIIELPHELQSLFNSMETIDLSKKAKLKL